MPPSVPATNPEFPLDQLATTANNYHEKVTRAAHQMLFFAKEAGCALEAAKCQVGHGEFQEWLSANFDASIRTANLYMRIFRNWTKLEDRFGRTPKLTIDQARRFLSHVNKSQPEESTHLERPGLLIRESLLRQLDSVELGLVEKELEVTHGSFLLFQDKHVFTQSGGVACVCPCDLHIDGAVPGRSLLVALRNIDATHVKATTSDKGLEITGGACSVALQLVTNHGLLLPRIPSDLHWKGVADGFVEAVQAVAPIAFRFKEDHPCAHVHIADKWIEACDNFLAVRFDVALHLSEPLLVRGDILHRIVETSPTAVALDSTSIYFRNDNGLILSCDRRPATSYPDLTPFIEIVTVHTLAMSGVGFFPSR